MFDRMKYKDFAKKQLSKRWKVPILMTLVTFLIGALFGMKSFFQPNFSQSFSQFMDGSATYNEFINEITVETPVSSFLSLLQTIVQGILAVACINVYLKMSRSPEEVKFSSFIDGLNFWWRATLSTLWSFLWTFLWSLLFLIPGIVKAIAYSQMNYLIVEYPNLSITKAMKISMLITKGHKGDLFVTYLSFLGWAILATIPAGLGFLVLSPYMEMTFVNAYHALLKEAIESGKIKPEDLTE